MDIPAGRLFVGGVLDPNSGERTNEAVALQPHDLTTHGVIVGMTGSGKTGLAIDIVEEALLSGIPCLILDPKGDMGNLMLNFPDFRPEDFRPWVDEAAARREGISADSLAASTAETWKKGLASWGIGPDRMRRLKSGVEIAIYTPGSTAGIALNVVGSLAAPSLSWDTEAETLRDEIESFVSSLLTLAGIEADPVTSPEHILLATIVEHSWRNGRDLDLPGLIGQVQQPPIRKLGVFALDAFFEPEKRAVLAKRLNGLVASPSFASWLEGPPLEVASMLWTPGGKARGAVVYLAHLSDAERQFVVTLLLSKLVTWMRAQSGTSDLRLLVYMDELFGFCPPTAEPPSKRPILTILKQARAFGVGMVVATQNPVDLDYKAMSNAGTWLVGRLHTERDKARILEGMKSASGSIDVESFDKRITGLDKRQFVMRSTHTSQPTVFTSRWAMSYLAGPLTREQVATLAKARPAEASVPAGAVVSLTPAPSGDTVPVAPTVAEGVRVAYLDSAAEWATTLGAKAAGNRLEPMLAATVHLRYDDTGSGIDHREDFEAVIYPLGPSFAPEAVRAVDHDSRDFAGLEPEGAAYVLPDVPIGQGGYFKSLQMALTDWLSANRRLTIYCNPALKLYSRIGESQAEFEGRCAAAAEDAADNEVARLRDKYRAGIDRAKGQLATAERRVRELEEDVAGRRQHEMLAGAGDLLGALLTGRRRSSGLSQAAARRRQTRSTEERLRSAEAKLAEEAVEIEELEADLASDIVEITGRWNGVAGEIRPLEIPLERTDVSLEPLMLVWVPT